MPSDDEDEDTLSISPDDDPVLCAQLTVEGVVSTHALPLVGLVDIGRAASCGLVIDHASVSRHHAKLQVSPLQITDQNSKNGTFVRGEPIKPGQATSVSIGETVQIGHVTMLIQRKPRIHDEVRQGSQRTSSEALIGQLAVECSRSARSGSPFAFARVHIEEGAVTYEQLRATMRTTDVIADSDGRFELLLPETSTEQVAGAVARVTGLIKTHKAKARIVVARYPYDGVTAEALIARVWELLERSPGASATQMDAVRSLIQQVGASDVSVLISGETGVGKELCAEMLHRQSARASKPFVKLNCSAITESLIESELFGHERGSFTGATSSTTGLLEAGHGGTVFLDEIGELPLAAQAKLLRVLEERVVRRVGANAGRTIDVRFVCATNRDLPDEVDAGRFRRDLYYRINGVSVAIPPLRDRQAEIGALARAFATRPRGRTQPATLGSDVIQALAQHPWPGNIRELRNTIERALVLAAGGPVKPEHLTLDETRRGSVPTSPFDRISASDITPTPPTSDAPLSAAVAEVERKRILEVLERCGGNQTRAARQLGISRNTLLARLDSYGLPRPRKGVNEPGESE